MTNLDSISAANDKELLLLVPSEHACYADHFPGNPLVPGALLLKWILARLEREFNCKVSNLKNIKFLAPVKPADTLKIIMIGDRTTAQLSFNIFVLSTQVIKGSIECSYD